MTNIYFYFLGVVHQQNTTVTCQVVYGEEEGGGGGQSTGPGFLAIAVIWCGVSCAQKRYNRRRDMEAKPSS